MDLLDLTVVAFDLAAVTTPVAIGLEGRRRRRAARAERNGGPKGRGRIEPCELSTATAKHAEQNSSGSNSSADYGHVPLKNHTLCISHAKNVLRVSKLADACDGVAESDSPPATRHAEQRPSETSSRVGHQPPIDGRLWSPVATPKAPRARRPGPQLLPASRRSRGHNRPAGSRCQCQAVRPCSGCACCC